MCTIDKMLIKGIRSFSPDNTAVIEFYKPLTLIVGHNGAGKTTIIECLKMACTGELPPNTRSGQSFIHDPKVAGETDVKAQIKLRFNTAVQQPVVVIRSFQLVQKKTTVAFSSLDQVVQIYNKETGQKEALSYRCADMDRIVPQLMGVSKAIMENVVFVHQDDSNWPLSEGQVLKKKFDDIFSATKYTKALEALVKLKKEKAAETKEFKLKLEHLKTHKENAHKLRTEVEKGTKRTADLTANIQQLESQINAHSEEIKEIDAQMLKWQDEKEALTKLKTRLEMVVTQNAKDQVQLISAYGEEELDVELSELLEWEKELEPRIQDLLAHMDKLGYDIRASESKVASLKSQYGTDLKNEATLAAEAEAHARNIADRDRTLRDVSQQAGVGRLPNNTLTEEAVKGFLLGLRQHVAQQEQALRELRTKHQQQDDENSRLVDQVSGQIASATQKAKIKQQTLDQNEGRINSLQRELESSSISRVMVDDAEEAERSAKHRQKAKQEALEKEDISGGLGKIATGLETLQRKTTALRQERDHLSMAAEEGAQLQVLRKERNQKQSQIDTLVSNRRQALAKILECPPQDVPQPDKLKAAIDRVQGNLQGQLSKKAEEVRKAQSQASSSNGTLAACNAQLSQQRTEADGLQNKLDASLAQINSQGTAGSLDACVSTCEKQQSKEKGQLERVKALEINIKQFKATAERQNICEVCKRPFHGDERQEFLRTQDQTSRDIPGAKSQLQNAIQATEGKLKALRALQPDWARLEKLRSTVMAATSEKLRQLEIQATTEAGVAAERLEEQEGLQQRMQDIQQMLRDVAWPIDRMAAEIATLKADITRIENRMRIAGTARTVAEVDAELEALDTERGQLERQKDELLRRQGRMRDEIAHLQNAWHAAREEAMNLRNAAEKRAALESEVSGLQALNVQLEHESTDAAQSVEPLKAKRDQLVRDRQQMRGASRDREAERESRLRELQSLQVQVQDRIRNVDNYHRANKADRLQTVRHALQRTSQQLSDEEAKLKGLEQEQKEGEREQVNNNQNKRQIQDLIQYKRGLEEEEKGKAEIQQIQAELGCVGDMTETSNRFSQLQRSCNELRKKQNMSQGSLATVTEGLLRAKKELESVNFRDIDQRFWKQLLELKTTEMAVGDLEKYHKALEKALLSFHTTKMADINKTIKELWQRTYRNCDIDYIEIKADTDTGKGTKSYNYRVVMHISGAELEMRGRCSAGQKVLACLIIRLALAETFCLNCGILALDEPTTNLDAENAASLAEALRSIMESRKAQSNFQLVIITHDEKFAHLIGTREHAENLWRITKDDRQHSHLEKEELLE